MLVVAETPRQLVYFISGMWCSTCAKNIGKSVLAIDGVEAADVNYSSKLLLVKTQGTSDNGVLDSSIQTKVSQIGFGIKKQPEDWVLRFHKELELESNRKIPWTQVSIVWFLAMWSSMIAFAGYLGGDLSANDLYWLSVASSVFGLPAIVLGIIPYANSGLRALWFSKLPTLDLFIFIGGCSAIGVSLLSLASRSSVTYADSGSMIIAILLLTKKIENVITKNITSNILFQLHPKNKLVEVLKNSQWKTAEVSQVKAGDRVRIFPDETVPFDGVVQNADGAINNHLLSGERTPLSLRPGDHVFAGAIAKSLLELTVSAPQGQRKIDAWAETALLSVNTKSSYGRLFVRAESILVLVAMCGAVLIAGIHAIRGANSQMIIESFFVGVLVFCPCLFASIIPLTKQMAHMALFRAGVIVSRTDALLDLAHIRNFYFDKTGTLEAVESTFVSFDDDNTVPLYLKELASKSQHVTLRGLRDAQDQSLLESINEHPGLGVVARTRDGEQLTVGRISFLKEQGIESDSELDPAFSYVGFRGNVVGQIVRKQIYDAQSKLFLQKLLTMHSDTRIEIISGDPARDAGRDFSTISEKIVYRGNLSPEEKVQALQAPCAFVGDGLNDTLALAKANVSFRLGSRIMGFAPVDFHLQVSNLELVLLVTRYAKKYRAVLIQTASAAFVYNGIALTLAILGKFSPLGAVLAMSGSFSLMLLSVFRLSRLPSHAQ